MHSPILFIKHTDKIFRRAESKMIGRKFEQGPCVFPGFRRSISIPVVNSFGLKESVGPCNSFTNCFRKAGI